MPKGENLLIYGENGAGKSSLFNALRMFFEAPGIRVPEPTASHPNATRPVSIIDHKHRFTSDEPALKLEFGDQSFEWSAQKNDTTHELVRFLNQGKGFLDYKSLLEVHYVRSNEKAEIDLFPLLIRSLLPYYTYPYHGKNKTFQSGWESLKKDVRRTWRRKNAEATFKADLTTFNEVLEKAVYDLAGRATEMLKVFGDEFQVELRLVKGHFKSSPKRIDGPRLLALPAFRKQQISDYHGFFNEARLSALAICLFLSALKESPATGLRLLALDDILIGLDMSNRVKVIDLVQEYFKQWQIIILTYSKSWFERLKAHLKSSNMDAPWKAVVLFEDHREQEPSPRVVVEDSGDRIEMANSHLRRKDYHGAAVYARIALEGMCHLACAEGSIPVHHVESLKDRKLEHFLVALSAKLGELLDDARRRTALQLMARVHAAKSFVLNRNSHFDTEEEDALSGEIGSAISAVKEFGVFLESQHWAKSNFRGGQQLSPDERLAANIGAAREAVGQAGLKQALGALSDANEAFWEVHGSRLGVLFPVGAKPKTSDIWKAAQDQKLLSASIEARLSPLRPYLYGSVKTKDFDVMKFAEAVNALEELATPPAPA